MLSTTRHLVKQYIERGVQTDTFPRKTPPSEPSPSHRMDSSAHPQSDDVCSTSVTSPSACGRSRTATEDEGAYSQCSTDISFDSASSTADRSMTTTTRAYKMDSGPVSANRPTTLLNRQPTSRVVSLPEATPRFRMKTALEKKTGRVVSMPVPAIRDSLGDCLDAQSIVGDPFVSEDEERTRVRVQSHATDVPHTPSTPSSPDSVVIIANTSNQLSNEFLKPRVDDESTAGSDDEGWITWSRSPPRPIPALHGPLSLPYARCPSGAEGTIIEEPDSLPRVIWGLDTEDTNGRNHPKSSNTQSAVVKLPTDTASETGRPTVKTKQEDKPSSAQRPQVPSKVHVGRATQNQQSATAPRPTLEFPRPPDFILKHSEPIDLGRLMGCSLDRNHLEVVPDGTLPSPGWRTSGSNELPTPDLIHDLSPELQTMLFAQDRLRSQGLTTSTWGSGSDIHSLSNISIPASSSSSSLLESLKSSRSPILLEELASQHLHHPQGPVSQTSALDIAQNYRQQHLQSILPTPPDSTSPIWSSTFSPYQGGILSPELLAAAGLSQTNSGYLSSQVVPPRLESSQNLLRPVLGNAGLGARRGSLSPAAHITNVNAQKLPPRLAAEYARRRSMPDTLKDVLQLQSDPGFQYSSPLRNSPTMPKAPPNTPYDSVSPYGPRRLDAVPITQPSFPAAPCSPTSTRDVQNICLPQHIRSVPLSRLVQRRLSTVPEEDYASSVETGRTSPAPGRASAQGPATGLHLFLSPSGRSNLKPAPLDLLGDHVGGRYGAGDAGGSADKARTITSGVKLPNVPGRETGPVASREAQFVKEAWRRQGSGNINSDGRRRGEGGRGRGHKRGGRGRKGRGGHAHGIHAERVDGGLVVKS